MRELYRLLMALYPAHIRSEFGEEMLDVFEQASNVERSRGRAAYIRFCAREAGGLVVNLLAQRTSMKHKRLMMQGALAGLLAGGVFAWLWDARPYTSTAMLRIVPSMISEQLVPAQNHITPEAGLPLIIQTVTSRSNLADLANLYKLYPDERAHMPVDKIVERMREAIRISSAKASVFDVSFTYSDPILAQKVTADLVNRMMTQYSRERMNLAALNLQFLRESADKAGVAWEQSLTKLKDAQASGRGLDRVGLDAEIAKQRYLSLSEKVADAGMLDELERRHQGQTLELIDPASLPEDSRLSVIQAGALGLFAGAFFGWLLSIVFTGRSREAIPEAA